MHHGQHHKTIGNLATYVLGQVLYQVMLQWADTELATLVLSVLPLLTVELSINCAMTPEIASKVAYGHACMKTRGSVSGWWFWEHIPRACPIMNRPGMVSTHASNTLNVFLDKATCSTPKDSIPSQFRKLRRRVLRKIRRIPVSTDSPCLDMPALEYHVALFVAWLRLLMVWIEDEFHHAALECDGDGCGRTIVGSACTPLSYQVGSLVGVMQHCPTAQREYWTRLVSEGLGIDRSKLAPQVAHHRFCSPACQRKWSLQLWSKLPPIYTPAITTRKLRDSMCTSPLARMHRMIEQTIERNSRARVHMNTSKKLEDEEVRLFQKAVIFALNVDIGIMVSLQRMLGSARTDTIAGLIRRTGTACASLNDAIYYISKLLREHPAKEPIVQIHLRTPPFIEAARNASLPLFKSLISS